MRGMHAEYMLVRGHSTYKHVSRIDQHISSVPVHCVCVCMSMSACVRIRAHSAVIL